MKIRLSVSLGMLVALVMLLSACVPAATPSPAAAPEATSTSPPASAEEPSPEVEEVPAHKEFEGTTLHLLFKEGYDVEVIFAHQEEFEEATGIELSIEQFDEPTTRQKFILNATTKAGAYDIVPISFWYFPEYHRSGWIEPLDDYVENKADPEWFGLDQLPQSALDVFSRDGELHALPHTVISGMFHYRKDIFEECGIELPETTEDILAAAPIIKECKPDIYAYAGRGAPTFPSLGTYLGWAYGYGALLFDEELRPHANSPEMIEAMEDLVSLYRDYGPEDQATLTFMTLGDRAMAGQVAMFHETSGWGTVLEQPETSQTVDKWGYTLLEGPEGNPLQWLYMEALAIPADSPNKDAAWLFLQWRTSLDTMMTEMLDGRTDTPNLAVLGSEEYKQLIADRGEGAVTHAELLPASWAMATNEHWPNVPEFVEIGDIFSQGMSDAIAGTKTVEEALDEIQENLDNLMREAGYYE
jgi:ABC-type glycerol-3-phosphate transport system substrate-binding protein